MRTAGGDRFGSLRARRSPLIERLHVGKACRSASLFSAG